MNQLTFKEWLLIIGAKNYTVGNIALYVQNTPEFPDTDDYRSRLFGTT